MTSGRDRQWDEGKDVLNQLALSANKEPGMKFDSSKPDMRLIPPLAELEMAKVLTFGAEKYAPDNWKKVEPERYISAAMRHINAIRQGELVDSESGCHHAAHLMCCAAFMVELMKTDPSLINTPDDGGSHEGSEV